MTALTFSRAEVASAIGCSAEVLANWIKRGVGLFEPDNVAIVSTGPGRGYRFSVEAAVQAAVAVNLTRFGASPETALREGFRFSSNPNDEWRYGRVSNAQSPSLRRLEAGELRAAPLPFARGETLGVWAPNQRLKVINVEERGPSIPEHVLRSLVKEADSPGGYVTLHLDHIYDRTVTRLFPDPEAPHRRWRQAAVDAAGNPSKHVDPGTGEALE